MLKENQTTEMRWHPQNKQYYTDRGYVFTKMRDVFLVNVKDLPHGSHAKVVVVCDYCGKETIRTYKDYCNHHDDKMGDCCCQCKAVKAKITNLENLGVEFPMQSKEVQNKSQQTCLKHYGVKHALQSQEIKEKAINTILKKYGVENIAKSQKCINKIKQTNLKRYGVEFACCNEEVRNKMRESLYKNGSCKTSAQQRKVCDMLLEIYGNCELNYPVSNCSLDCLIIVNDLKINIEYDGWYWHKDKQERDRRRDEFLKSQGYKILRIKASRMIPTKEQLKNAIDYLVKGNHSYTEIILDI